MVVGAKIYVFLYQASAPPKIANRGLSLQITPNGTTFAIIRGGLQQQGAKWRVLLLAKGDCYSSVACSWSRPFSSSIVERSSSRSFRSCSFSARIASTSTPVGAPMYLRCIARVVAVRLCTRGRTRRRTEINRHALFPENDKRGHMYQYRK